MTTKKIHFITMLSALIALGVSILSLIIANDANDIAEYSQEMQRQINQPIISAIIEQNVYGNTETLIVKNGSAPLKDFKCNEYAVLVIYALKITQNIPYIPLEGYYNGKGSGNLQGLLYSASKENNYKIYNSIKEEFLNAAEMDGYSSIDIGKTDIVFVEYHDQFGEEYQQYICLNQNTNQYNTYDLGNEEAENILVNMDSYKRSTLNYGCNLDIDELQGYTLWRWYKTEILQK